MSGVLDLIELSDRFRRFGAPLPVQQDIAEKLVNAARVFAVRLTYYYPEYGIEASVNAQPIRSLAQSVSEISALLREAGYGSAMLPLNEEYPQAAEIIAKALEVADVSVPEGAAPPFTLQPKGAEYSQNLSEQGYPIDVTIRTILDDGYRGGFSVNDEVKYAWRGEKRESNNLVLDL